MNESRNLVSETDEFDLVDVDVVNSFLLHFTMLLYSKLSTSRPIFIHMNLMSSDTLEFTLKTSQLVKVNQIYRRKNTVKMFSWSNLLISVSWFLYILGKKGWTPGLLTSPLLQELPASFLQDRCSCEAAQSEVPGTEGWTEPNREKSFQSGGCCF